MADTGPAVVERAMSLCTQYKSSERREVLRSYWPFFRDDKHFASWCHIGFSFEDGMKAVMLAGYKQTLISDMARLNEGNYFSGRQCYFSIYFLPVTKSMSILSLFPRHYTGLTDLISPTVVPEVICITLDHFKIFD